MRTGRLLTLLPILAALTLPHVAEAKRKKKKKPPTTQQDNTPDVTPDSGTPDVTPDSGTPDVTPDSGTPDVTPDNGTPDVTPDVTPDTGTTGGTTGTPDNPGGTTDVTPDVTPDTGPTPVVKLGEKRAGWADIEVVVRKPFLKQHRVELQPSFGITLNDNMIRHYAFDGQVNYWLTDVLAVGLEGQYFVHEFLDPYANIAHQYRRLPTLNKYNFGILANFHYVPIYGKFTMLNRSIVHWEGMFTAGVGVTQSEVLPRDPSLPGWTNILITPDVGFQARVFMTKWITLDLGVKDYIFIDKYEAVDRKTASVDDAKANATGKLVNHVMFTVGLSFWVPPTFEYTTFR